LPPGARDVILARLARLSEKESALLLGKPDEAETLLTEARDVAAYICDNAGSDELRESFLALPGSQRLRLVQSWRLNQSPALKSIDGSIYR